jgi:methylmalonyl-CoA/ethylmalonyl-CoA epimerase
MKILNIDHIGIAAESMEGSLAVFEGLLGLTLAGTETVADQKVKTAFLPVGDSEVELLESTDPEGPIGKFIAAKGQGFQHIAFRVEDLEAALAELKAKGVRLIDEVPRSGAGGAKIAFIHPKATAGVLVELCERKGR